MAQDNVATARLLYTAFDAATAPPELDMLRAIIDPDVVIEEVADFPDGSIYHGLEGVQTWMQGFFDVFEEITIEPQEFIEAGDTIVVPTKQRFRSKAGLDVEWEVTQVVRFRDGKLIHATGYRDHAKALAAAGLAE
jgi:ketosteroid isomerase-like protein